MTAVRPTGWDTVWYALSTKDAASQLGVDPEQGLTTEDAARRLEEYGPNELLRRQRHEATDLGSGQSAAVPAQV